MVDYLPLKSTYEMLNRQLLGGGGLFLAKNKHVLKGLTPFPQPPFSSSKYILYIPAPFSLMLMKVKHTKEKPDHNFPSELLPGLCEKHHRNSRGMRSSFFVVLLLKN